MVIDESLSVENDAFRGPFLGTLQRVLRLAIGRIMQILFNHSPTKHGSAPVER